MTVTSSAWTLLTLRDAELDFLSFGRLNRCSGEFSLANRAARRSFGSVIVPPEAIRPPLTIEDQSTARRGEDFAQLAEEVASGCSYRSMARRLPAGDRLALAMSRTGALLLTVYWL
jgi:hypothetical protein